MREMTEALYDYVSPEYWVKFGLYENAAQLNYLQKFLGKLGAGGTILSAACGAGRYDGLLLEAGHSVVGIDQSAGMLALAREHFPQARYEKVGLQEIARHPAYQAMFEGAICMDAMEHICPEDWPGIVRGFAGALKPDGVLYFTVEISDAEEVETSYKRAVEMGLPVVYGELADKVEASYQRVIAAKPASEPGERVEVAVYHYYPTTAQVWEWIAAAGMVIEEEGAGSGYYHFITKNAGIFNLRRKE
ncbi:MAG TPA: class I SAM-dependent methyltransferase [Anaerolineaceae bacterium]